MSRCLSISDRHYSIRLLSSTRSVFRLACRIELNRVLFLIPFYTDNNTPDDVIKHLPLCNAHVLRATSQMYLLGYGI